MNAKSIGSKLGIVTANTVDFTIDAFNGTHDAVEDAAAAFGSAYKAQRAANAARRNKVANPTIVGKRGLKTA